MSLERTISRIAKTYYDVLAEGAQPAQVQALAMMSDIISTEHDVRKVVDTIALRAGKADDLALRQVLVIMQRKFEQRMCEDWVSRLGALFHKEREKGWIAWLEALADAFLDGPTRLLEMLISEEFAYPEHVESDIVRIRRLTKYIIQERFGEGYELYTYLVGQEVIAPARRAKLLVYAAEVQIIWFNQLDEGKRLLQLAEELAPDEIVVKCGWANYWLQQSKIPEAKNYLEQALKQGDPVKETYYLMGDCYSQQGDYNAAEEWYREATKQVDSSASVGYTRLLQLYGRTEELFHAHEAEFVSLLERAVAMDPTKEYSGYLVISANYQQYHLYKQAHDWCERAIQADISWVDGYLSSGLIYTEEGRFDCENKRYDAAEAAFKQAEAAFQKVIEIDSTIFDGYWNLGELREQQERWQEAYDWYERSLPFRFMWEQSTRTRMGEMLWRLGRYEEAIEEVIGALRLKPEEPGPVNTLETWAEDFYTKLNRSDDAQHLYDTIRKVVGLSYEASYQNLLGNLAYYRGNYQAAIDYYGKAIAAESTEPVFFSNLANAWEQASRSGQQLEALEKAIAALRQACDLAPKMSSYSERLAWLETQAKFVRQFGVFILDLVPEGSSIVVELGEQLIKAAGMVDGKLPNDVETIINTMRQNVLEQYGVRIPSITFNDNSELDRGGYVLKVPGLPPISGTVPVDKRYCERSASVLSALGIAAETIEGFDGCWIAEQDWSKVEKSGLSLWMEIEVPLRHLEYTLSLNLPTLADHSQIDAMLAEKTVTTVAMFKAQPTLLTKFIVVLKALLTERISIAPLEQITEVFLEQFKNGEDALSIAERLRSLPTVVSKLPGKDPSFSYCPLSSELEAQLVSHVYQTGYEPVLSMQSNEFNVLMEGVAELLDNRPDRALLVSDSSLRPMVRAMTGVVWPLTPVLREDEVLQEGKEKVIGEIEGVHLTQFSGDDSARRQESKKQGEDRLRRDQFMVVASDRGEVKKEQRSRATGKLFDSESSVQDAEQIMVIVHPNVYQEIIVNDEQKSKLGGELAAVDETSISFWMNILQGLLYQDIGLLIPPLQFGSDERLGENEARIEPGAKQMSFELAAEHLQQEGAGNKDEASGGATESNKPFAMKVTADLLNYIEDHASEFLTVDSVRYSLILLRRSFPALVDSALERFELATLTQILKDLLDIRKSIKELRTILEELVMVNGTIKVDQEKHVLFPAGFVLTAPVQEGSILVFLPYTAKLCPTTEEKTIESLDTRDYARYVSQLTLGAS